MHKSPHPSRGYAAYRVCARRFIRTDWGSKDPYYADEYHIFSLDGQLYLSVIINKNYSETSYTLSPNVYHTNSKRSVSKNISAVPLYYQDSQLLVSYEYFKQLMCAIDRNEEKNPIVKIPTNVGKSIDPYAVDPTVPYNSGLPSVSSPGLSAPSVSPPQWNPVKAFFSAAGQDILRHLIIFPLLLGADYMNSEITEVIPEGGSKIPPEINPELAEGVGGLIPQGLMDELAASGVKFNPDDVVMIAKTTDGKLLWLENGTSTAGLKHIVEGHSADFAAKGITDIPRFLKQTLQNTPIYSGTSSAGPFADYLVNGNTYRIAYGTNGFIVTFYPIG